MAEKGRTTANHNHQRGKAQALRQQHGYRPFSRIQQKGHDTQLFTNQAGDISGANIFRARSPHIHPNQTPHEETKGDRANEIGQDDDEIIHKFSFTGKK